MPSPDDQRLVTAPEGNQGRTGGRLPANRRVLGLLRIPVGWPRWAANSGFQFPGCGPEQLMTAFGNVVRPIHEHPLVSPDAKRPS